MKTITRTSVMEMRKKTEITTTQKFEFDSGSSKELVKFLKTQDQLLQGILLWCSIAVMIGFILVIFAILQFYAGLSGHHTPSLAAALVFICLLLSLFIWLQFRIGTYKPTVTQIKLKEFCQFKMQVTRRQIRLLTGYLAAYALIVFTSCLACWLEAGDYRGAGKLFAVTAPVSIMVYVMGLYLLAKLGARWHALKKDIHNIDREIINTFSRQ